MAGKSAAQESAATVHRAVDRRFFRRFSTDAGAGCCFVEPLYFRLGAIYSGCQERNRTEEANKVLLVNISKRQSFLTLHFVISRAMISLCARAAMVLHRRFQRSRMAYGGAEDT